MYSTAMCSEIPKICLGGSIGPSAFEECLVYVPPSAPSTKLNTIKLPKATKTGKPALGLELSAILTVENGVERYDSGRGFEETNWGAKMKQYF